MKLVVFDMDGTLIDSSAFITSTLHEAFETNGLPAVSEAQARNIIGLSLEVALEQLSGLSGGELDELVTLYRKTYRQKLMEQHDQEPLYAGAKETLLELHKRPDIVLAIATGKGLSGVDRILALHGLTDLFVSKQTPDHNPSKPDPGMLFRAMEETGAESCDTVMIGDTSYDIDMAIAANTGALGVTWGSHDVQTLADCGAHVIVDQYSHVVDAIDDILETRRHLTHA